MKEGEEERCCCEVEEVKLWEVNRGQRVYASVNPQAANCERTLEFHSVGIAITSHVPHTYQQDLSCKSIFNGYIKSLMKPELWHKPIQTFLLSPLDQLHSHLKNLQPDGRIILGQ